MTCCDSVVCLMRVDDLLLTLRVVIFWVEWQGGRVFCQVYSLFSVGDSIVFEQLDVTNQVFIKDKATVVDDR